MVSPSPRLSSILLASALVLAPAAFASAMAEPSPAADSVGIPKPIPCIPVSTCLPKAAGTLQLQASAGESGGKQIEVLAWGWGAVDLPPAGSADPQEGGEIVSGVEDRATTEASSRKRQPSRDTIGEVVTKRPDKSSPILFSTPVGGATEAPPPSGMVTLLVPAGTCVQGAHYSTVTLQSEGKAYELHDVTVAECAPASVARGKKADKQKLQYLKVEMKEIFISG